MKPIEIAKGIYDVGVNDWNIEDFHGYSTPMGTSYNAFLIVDKKVALIDTVKKKFSDQLLDNISEIIDPKKIDCIISNHAELDHSGSLARMMHRIGEDKPIYCSKMGAKSLAKHFPQNFNYRTVKEGEEVSLGTRTLTFVETRMLHWPDNMFTYLKEDKILFSSDAFGQHYAGFEKYNDVIGDATTMAHAQKYYANILMLYAPHTLKLMDKVSSLGLEFNMICPDHGLIWRKNPGNIVDAYVEWSKQTAKRKAVVVYDTMWHSTERMADAVATGLSAEGINVRPMYLRKWHRSDIMTDVLDAKAVIIGSPTLNNNLFPTVSDFLTYMQGLRPLDKIGAAFGSYGWSGEAPKMINKALEDMKFDIVEPVRHQYIPDSSALKASYELGRSVGRAINDQVPQ
jgi:flavorubredoxin